MKSWKKITIKIGSNVLTKRDGKLDVTQISALVDQIAALHKKGIEVILISSGAVASGRSTLKVKKKMDVVDERQLYSAIGQTKLMNYYWDFFRDHGIVIGQILTTKENFSNRRGYLNQRNCIKVMLENSVIPIVNENDAVSVTELMFTDNDELSGMVASMMDSDALIILSNVDGIFTGLPTNPAAKRIEKVKKGESISEFIKSSKSSFGRGGMLTKEKIARKMADEGIDVFIANGKRENVILQILNDENFSLYTHFESVTDSVSSVKKWIAHSDGFAKGEITINENAEKALFGNKAVSVLPVGVVAISGDFQKDDIIRITGESGKYLGIGKAAYSSEKAKEIQGEKNQKPLIHYDYLFLE